MLDFGLLATGVAVWVVLLAAARWSPAGSDGEAHVVDRLMAPALAGLLGGRIVAAALDDPASLRSVRALLVLRGGLEFWPGVAVAAAALVLSVRRRGRADVWFALAELAPFALWGYATYEAACLLRDGCYGPASAVGLIPAGLRTRMFPVGLVVAAAVTGLGLAVRQLWALQPRTKLLMAVGGVAAVRAVAAVWLPRLGAGLTRQHRESIAIAAATAVVGLSWWVAAWWRRRHFAVREATTRGPVEAPVTQERLT